MNINEIRISRWFSRAFMLAFGLALVMAATPLISAQVSSPQATRTRTPNIRAVPSGEKMKFKGVVIRRDADTFMVRDRNRVDTQVLLTDATNIKKNRKALLWGGKKYAVTDTVPG